MSTTTTLSPADILEWSEAASRAAATLQGMRKTKSGGKSPGRPKSAQRCPCGEKPLGSRGHQTEEECRRTRLTPAQVMERARAARVSKPRQ